MLQPELFEELKRTPLSRDYWRIELSGRQSRKERFAVRARGFSFHPRAERRRLAGGSRQDMFQMSFDTPAASPPPRVSIWEVYEPSRKCH
jgi:hypothetical protein